MEKETTIEHRQEFVNGKIKSEGWMLNQAGIDHRFLYKESMKTIAQYVKDNPKMFE